MIRNGKKQENMLDKLIALTSREQMAYPHCTQLGQLWAEQIGFVFSLAVQL